MGRSKRGAAYLGLLLLFHAAFGSQLGRMASRQVVEDIEQYRTPNSSVLEARASCAKKSLSQQTWFDLDMNGYLRNYPGGQTLSLVAFADKVNMTNFACGIGSSCDAGELCHSVGGPAWQFLVATQNWNDMMNSIYKSIAFAIGTVQDLAPAMVTDLSPPLSSLPIKIATIMGVVASSTGIVPGWVFPGNGIWYYLTVQGFLYTTVSEISLYTNTIRTPPDVMSGYTKWTGFALLLSVLQEKAQQRVANYTLEVLQSGISSEKGLYGVLKNGTFLQDSPGTSQADSQNSVEEIIKLKLLSAILKARNTYITRGAEKCDHHGPNGALEDPRILSFCDEDGVMMNIVQAHGTKTVKNFYGSEKIVTKYGLTAEFLTQAAWRCQSKYQKYNYDPYQNSTLPQDINSDCLFNIPVCDCTREDIKLARKHGKRTAKACHEAGLPIYPTDDSSPYPT